MEPFDKETIAQVIEKYGQREEEEYGGGRTLPHV
jgi:hypothetical protein